MEDWTTRRRAFEAEFEEKEPSAEFERRTFELYEDAQRAIEAGDEERPVMLARWSALSAMGRIDCERSFQTLMKHITDDPGSTFFRVIRDALLGQSAEALPRMIVEKGLTREAIRLLMVRATPDIADAIAEMVADAEPGGAEPDSRVMVYGLIALARVGDKDAQERVARLFLERRYQEYVVAAISGRDPESTFEMLSPVVAQLDTGERDDTQTRTHILYNLNGSAQRSGAVDPRWLEVLNKDVADDGDRWVWIINGALPAPRFEGVMGLLADTTEPWPYWAALILATEGDARAIPTVLSIIGRRRSGYTSGELLKAVRNIPNAPDAELQALVVDQLIEMAGEYDGNYEAAEYLIDAWIEGGVLDVAGAERVAVALEGSNFAYEYKREGRKMLKALVARLRGAARR